MSTIYLKHLDKKIKIQRILLVISSICICLCCDYYFDINPMIKVQEGLCKQHKLNQSELVNNEKLIHQQPISPVSFQQIKMVGYLYDDKIFHAILKFPNGNSISVSRGVMLGPDNARVLIADENQVVIQSQDKQFIIKNSLKE